MNNSNVDNILVVVILAILLMYVYRGCSCDSGIDPTATDDAEGYGRQRRGPPPCKCTGNVCKCKVCTCKGRDKNCKCKMVARPRNNRRREGMESTSNVVEGMAPLNFGTFYNNYPRGECQTGKFLERKPCEVGNCPLGTTVSDQQFCRIQCAQDPDGDERQVCYDVCMRNIC